MSERPDLLGMYEPPVGRHVRAGMVQSADGGAAFHGVSGPLSTPADKLVFQVLRAHADVVLVGAGTARDEGYGPVSLPEPYQQWRASAGRTPNPALALLTRSGNVPAIPDAIVLQTDAASALDELASRGLTRVLCEGGPSLLGDLVRAGLLDELCCTTVPRLLGKAPGILGVDLDAPVELSLGHLVELEGSLLLRWVIAH
jgi:riboflavin biosynthesis pyrimidine reductase